VKLTPKIRKTLDIITQLIIAALSLSYIFYRIYTLPVEQVNTFVNTIFISSQVILFSLLLMTLMVVNWGIESLKWKLVISQAEEIKLGKAVFAVIGGLAVSVFTPNRVGEFVGRAFILKNTDPLKAILLTLVGSFSQIIVTLVLGTVAYIMFAPLYLPSLIPHSSWIVRGGAYTLVSVSLVLVFIFFNMSLLHRISILVPAKYSERVKNSIETVAGCPRSLLVKVVLLSILRYLVFSSQFYVTLRLMGLHFTVGQCLMVIPVFYLALAAIPTIALTEIGVRGSVALLLFGLITGTQGLAATDTIAVVSATTLIWLINIAIPSLAGVLVVFRLKFFRR